MANPTPILRALLAALLGIGALLVTLIAPTPAAACTWLSSERAEFVGQTPGATPVNAIFLREMSLTGGLLAPEDEALLEVDTDLTALLNQASRGTALEVMRLRPDVFAPGERDYVEPDSVAPAQTTVRSVRVEYFVDHEFDPEACGPGGDADVLVMSLDAADEGTATGRLWLGYFGDTEDEALAAEAPGILLAGDDEILVSLGDSSTHARSGVGFSRAERYCFAIAAMDQAGNIGPRSEPVCLDTDDPDDPLVEVVEPSCSVAGVEAAAGLPRLATIALALFALAVLVRRRRRMAGPA